MFLDADFYVKLVVWLRVSVNHFEYAHRLISFGVHAKVSTAGPLGNFVMFRAQNHICQKRKAIPLNTEWVGMGRPEPHASIRQ